MDLGISALGHIIDLGQTNNFNDIRDLQLKASEKCLNFAEQQGIDIVELIIDPPEVFINENIYEFVDLVNSYKLEKQIHGPYIDLNLSSHNKRIYYASQESYKETIELCYQINANIITLHPGYANFMLPPLRKFNLLQLKNSIIELLDFVDHQKLTVCLENMPKNAYIMTDNENLEKVFDTINREDLFLTYDTSHFYTCNGDVEKLWNKFSHTIKNVHIVENFSKFTDTHPPLGSGKIDFRKIFDVFRTYNYKGPIIIELASSKSLNQSINFINKFL